MARLTFFISFSLALAYIPSGLAGPACARKNFQKPDCVSLCKNRWGWSGTMMGTDPWGSVMKKVDAETWDNVISSACGTPVISPAVANAGSTQSTSAIQATETESANPIVVVTTASATSSVVPSITSTAISSSKVPSSSSAPSVLGLLASARHSSSSSPTPSTSTKPPVVQPTTATSTKSPAFKPPQATGTTAASTGSSGGTSGADIAAYLAGHNTVRAQHGAAPLTWNDNLASKAQQWANNCQFHHSGGSLGPFGENLAAGTGPQYGIAAGIKSWTDEVSKYNPSNPQASHFTQVVWKGTSEVGCAVQSCSGIFDASFGPAKFFVCEYSAQGNIDGEFAQNVQV